MRRAVGLVLGGVLLSGCGSGGDGVAAPRETPMTSPISSGTPAPSATAAVPDIEGLEVLAEDPSHEHRTGPIQYDRTPPLGGPHHPRWLACDVYREPVPHELAVHSLEHGAVWLAYDPDLPGDQVEVLERLASSSREYVLASPEQGLDSRIVAATWGAALEASEADDPTLEQLVRAYAGEGQGGEPGTPCRGGGVTLREARGLLGAGDEGTSALSARG